MTIPNAPAPHVLRSVPAAEGGALPDPQVHPELYDDVLVKRFIAWAIDSVLVWGLWLVLSVLSLGILIWLLPFFAVLDFVYRASTLSRRSATWGMRLAGIELRDRRGERLDGGQAFAHTCGYMASMVMFFPVQVASLAAMAVTERRQSLTDMVLGTAVLNRQV